MFRRILDVLTLCIASLVLLVSTSVHASIPQAHKAPKTALSAASPTEKRTKAKNHVGAECSYRSGSASLRLHWGNGFAKPNVTVYPLFRWKGRPWSAFGGPSGTYDMRARVWSPNTGTFLSIDALGYHDGRGTLFSWPNQNPVRFSDPSGRMGDPVSDLVERAGEVSGVFTAGTAAANGLVGGGVATAGISAGWLVLPAAIAAGAGLVIWNDWYNFKHPTIASGGAGGGSCRTDRHPQASFPGVPPAAGGGGGGADAGLPRLVTNPKHHPNSRSPEPKNVRELYARSVESPREPGARWAMDDDGVIHRFSPPNNGETHWNGSTNTPGRAPIDMDTIPIDIRRGFGL